MSPRVFGCLFCFVALAGPIAAGADAAPGEFVLWSYVEDAQVFPLCTTIMDGIKERTSDPTLAASQCEKNSQGLKGSSVTEIKKHCQYFAVQLEQYTVQGQYSTRLDWCGKMLQFHSFKLKHDLLNYLGPAVLWNTCSDSVALAITQGAGATAPEASIQANLPISCKIELEKQFKARAIPFQVATVGCKNFVKKASKALAARELDHKDHGKQFCDGKSMQQKPFDFSQASPMPAGFPLTSSKGAVPKVSLANLEKMIRSAFDTPRDAFNKYDTNGDGKLSAGEWSGLCRDLGIPKWDCDKLYKELDLNGDGEISASEWQHAMSVTLEDLRAYILQEYGNADEGWKAADADKDGRLTPDEFKAHCGTVGVTPENAARLFPQVDKDGDGSISEDEYRNVFGVDLAEFKKRARKKWGTPEESFKAMDANGDGEISPDEFVEACKQLNIPPERAEILFDELDADSSGGITPEEWEASMGLSKQDLQRTIIDKLGKPSDAFKKLDADGDGKITAKELEEALKDAGMTAEEAKEIAAAMDEDGTGISKDEWLEKSGAKDLASKRYATPKAAKHTHRVAQEFDSPKDAFDSMDANGDGNISPEEWQASFEKLGMTPEEAMAAFEELDVNGDGQISRDEFYQGFGKGGGSDDFRDVKPKPIEPLEPEITMKEFQLRIGKSFKNGKDAWAKLAGEGGSVTLDDFKKFCADMGIPPGQAAKLFKQMDADGDGKLSESEFQNGVGMTEDELRERALAKWGNADEILKQADTDGDGKVSKEELVDMMKKLGVTPENAEKLAKEMMVKYDADGDGKIEGKQFKAVFRATADDLAERLQEQMGSASEAFDSWDADGDGELSEEEFMKGAEDMGISKEAAKAIWKDKAKDGKMDKDAFVDVFGIGPDQLLAKCFEHLQNPAEAFKELDVDGDMLVSEDEWKAFATKLHLSAEQAESLWKRIDTNEGEHTQGHMSQWEFFHFMDYQEPKKITWADGFGDLDSFGADHKKFNTLGGKPTDPNYGIMQTPNAVSAIIVNPSYGGKPNAITVVARPVVSVSVGTAMAVRNRTAVTVKAATAMKTPGPANRTAATATAEAVHRLEKANTTEAAPLQTQAPKVPPKQADLDAKDAEIARLRAELEEVHQHAKASNATSVNGTAPSANTSARAVAFMSAKGVR